MRKKIGGLSVVEWQYMKICWRKGKSTAKEIHEEYLKNEKHSYVTTKTILDRLVEKDFLEREKFGPVWLYSPKVSEKTTTSQAIDDFFKNVLDNTIGPIFLHIVKNKKKYREEIKELKKMVDDLDEEE